MHRLLLGALKGLARCFQTDQHVGPYTWMPRVTLTCGIASQAELARFAVPLLRRSLLGCILHLGVKDCSKFLLLLGEQQPAPQLQHLLLQPVPLSGT